MTRRLGTLVVMVAALVTTACGRSPATESPAVGGHRVQSTRVAAQGSVPYQIGAYELVFDAHRAALLVDLAGGQGLARGFVELSRPGETPLTYAAGGWARQRAVDGDIVTVFELALNRLGPRAPAPARPEDLNPVAVRVVVHEASGDATLTRRR